MAPPPWPFPGPMAPEGGTVCFSHFWIASPPGEVQSQTLTRSLAAGAAKHAALEGQGLGSSFRWASKKTLQVKLVWSSLWSPKLFTQCELSPRNSFPFALSTFHYDRSFFFLKKRQYKKNKTLKLKKPTNRQPTKRLLEHWDRERKSPPFQADVAGADILPVPWTELFPPRCQAVGGWGSQNCLFQTPQRQRLLPSKTNED